MDNLERKRHEDELKAQVKRQVEADLKLDFDARYQALERRLQERDAKISSLETTCRQKE